MEKKTEKEIRSKQLCVCVCIHMSLCSLNVCKGRRTERDRKTERERQGEGERDTGSHTVRGSCCSLRERQGDGERETGRGRKRHWERERETLAVTQ